jgi:hypothetical protein
MILIHTIEERDAAPSIEADSRFNAIEGGSNSRLQGCSMGDPERPRLSRRFPFERIGHHGLRLMPPRGFDHW